MSFDASASTDGGSPITGLRLQFGDATADANWTDKNVTQSHQYASASTAYTATATLSVSNAIGTSAPVTQQITVNPTGGPVGPTAQLTVIPSSGTAPLPVSFNASGSTQGTAAITGLRLVFDDGTQDATWPDKNQAQPHTYAARATPYNATLTVTDANGLSDSKTLPVTVTGGTTEFPSPKTAIPAGSGETRATFHSMSLYWNPSGFSDVNPPPGSRIFVRYRKVTEDPNAAGFAWKQAWPLWYDTRSATAGWGTLPYTYRGRGSVVYLTPGTKYIFELGTGTDYATANFTHYLEGTTRSETFTETVATTIAPRVPADGPLVITVGGDPATKTYKVYDGWNGTSTNVIDRGGAGSTDPNIGFRSDMSTVPDDGSAIVVKASYVIIRRVTVKGAALANIFIHPNVTDVVVEDCDITDWAWKPNDFFQPAPTAWGQVGYDEAGGVMASGNNSRIVVQRNKIYDPHLGNNPWDFGHPFGPMGVTIWHGGMQNVIRYNEIYSTIPDKKHWFLDAIAGSDNFSDRGAPGSDSDVYHNNIRNVMDDGIEAEGGGLNVRVWGNYIDHSDTGVATTTVHFGPTYVFRNVINRLRGRHTTTTPDNPRIPPNGIADPDDDFWGRGEGFKAYGSCCPGDVLWGGGRKYFFHNTQLQQPRSTYNPPQQWGDLGAGGGIFAADGQGMRESWSRNNILDTFRPTDDGLGGVAGAIGIGTGGTATNDFDFDLCNGTVPANTPPFEANGVFGKPTFRSGHGWMAFPRFSSAPPEPPETIFGTGLASGWATSSCSTAVPRPARAGAPAHRYPISASTSTTCRSRASRASRRARERAPAPATRVARTWARTTARRRRR